MPSRIANNPLIMDELPKLRQTAIQSAVKQLNTSSSSDTVVANSNTIIAAKNNTIVGKSTKNGINNNTTPSTSVNITTTVNNTTLSEEQRKNRAANREANLAKIKASRAAAANAKSKNINNHSDELRNRINKIYDAIIKNLNLSITPEHVNQIKEGAFLEVESIVKAKGYNSINNSILTEAVTFMLKQLDYNISTESES